MEGGFCRLGLDWVAFHFVLGFKIILFYFSGSWRPPEVAVSLTQRMTPRSSPRAFVGVLFHVSCRQASSRFLFGVFPVLRRIGFHSFSSFLHDVSRLVTR